MANLKEIAEAAWLQIGGGTDESRITLEEVIATAKSEYAYQMLIYTWNLKDREGGYAIPGHLVVQSEPLKVKDNKIDISKLSILFSLPCELWLQNIGGLTCDCEYIKSTVNNSQLLCDDDSLPDGTRTFLVIGKEIHFPKGTHATELPIIYATSGVTDNEDVIEVDDAIGGIVRGRLIEIYLGKTTPEDKTNNTNPNG